jgi:hypothetical protein
MSRDYCHATIRNSSTIKSLAEQVGKLIEHARKLLGFSAAEEGMRASTWLI